MWEIFIQFPHYGNFLLHKLNSCCGNYSRGKSIQGRKLFTKIRYSHFFHHRTQLQNVIFLPIASREGTNFYQQFQECSFYITEVTIIPTYDSDVLGYWVADNEDALTEYKIDLAPSASRCTINLQDHETSCAAYRLEFQRGNCLPAQPKKQNGLTTIM